MVTVAKLPGIMIAIVGPSGAGKDSLINLARAHYLDNPRIAFVRRVITRAADGVTEDHIPATEADFGMLERQGRFAVTWSAHGLRYGIGVETLDEIAAGQVLIANGSRAALDYFRDTYSNLAILEITARPEVIAARLAQRGRESAVEIEKRLSRDTGRWQSDCLHAQIDNSGDIEDAARQLYGAIDTLAGLGGCR